MSKSGVDTQQEWHSKEALGFYTALLSSTTFLLSLSCCMSAGSRWCRRVDLSCCFSYLFSAFSKGFEVYLQSPAAGSSPWCCASSRKQSPPQEFLGSPLFLYFCSWIMASLSRTTSRRSWCPWELMGNSYLFSRNGVLLLIFCQLHFLWDQIPVFRWTYGCKYFTWWQDRMAKSFSK